MCNLSSRKGASLAAVGNPEPNADLYIVQDRKTLQIISKGNPLAAARHR